MADGNMADAAQPRETVPLEHDATDQKPPTQTGCLDHEPQKSVADHADSMFVHRPCAPEVSGKGAEAGKAEGEENQDQQPI